MLWVGLAGRHVDRPCGGANFRHGLLEKSLSKCKCSLGATMLLEIIT